MLALLAEVRRDVEGNRWPGVPPRTFATMIGMETRQRVAVYARDALGEEADVRIVDARGTAFPSADVVLLFDVLHLMSEAEQDALLTKLLSCLRPDGVLVIREADAAAGWRFAVVRAGNRLKALSVGQWRQGFHFRSSAEWLECFARLGLVAEVRHMGHGTPFGNVLFRVAAQRTGPPESPALNVRDAAPVA
jgi:hypothetical protein